MRRPHLFLFCALAAFAALLAPAAAEAQAQDAQKVIDQYVKATGGSKALSRIQTLSLEGAIASGAASGTFTLDTKIPNRYYSEIILGDKRFIEAYNGKSAWHEDAAGTPSTFTGPESLQLQAAAQLANSRLLNLKKNKITVALVGHAQVAGRDAIDLEFTAANGMKRQLYFDSQSHLLVKETGTLAGIDQEFLYSDYRPENGVQLPHTISLRRGSDTFTVSITQASVNGVVGERVFDLPVKSQVHLPDLKTLFEEIDRNQKAIDKLKEDYAGTRVEDETDLDGNGKVKKHEAREYSFFYLDGEEISTLAKRDGKPLSDAEAKKETENAQKRVEIIQKQRAKKDAKEEKRAEEGKADDPDKDDPNIETFLRTSQFVNPRRERFRGQDVLVFDFEGNPEYKPRNLVEKIVQKLAGVVWIDEKALDVVRLEAYFVRDAKIAGGVLANLQKGTGFVFEQEYLNNEVWLPTYEEAHIGVRVLMVKGFHVSEIVRYSDYKKFHVETLSTIGQPKQLQDAGQTQPPTQTAQPAQSDPAPKPPARPQ